MNKREKYLRNKKRNYRDLIMTRTVGSIEWKSMKRRQRYWVLEVANRINNHIKLDSHVLEVNTKLKKAFTIYQMWRRKILKNCSLSKTTKLKDMCNVCPTLCSRDVGCHAKGDEETEIVSYEMYSRHPWLHAVAQEREWGTSERKRWAGNWGANERIGTDMVLASSEDAQPLASETAFGSLN